MTDARWSDVYPQCHRCESPLIVEGRCLTCGVRATSWPMCVPAAIYEALMDATRICLEGSSLDEWMKIQKCLSEFGEMPEDS